MTGLGVVIAVAVGVVVAAQLACCLSAVNRALAPTTDQLLTGASS